MKKILSTVLALCMILGCMAVGFTAHATPEADLQNGINAAIANGTDFEWTGADVNLTKALTINGNVKVDFKGATILGAPHCNTIVIGGGNVELINADIEGTSSAYHYINGFAEEVEKACPTILINNATVTLTDLIVTGAYIRVVGTHPQTGEKIPLSDAITMGTANSVLNLHNVRAFGNNGVENLNGSRVNVVDCLVGGYINDFYNDAAVSFADNTQQYSGFDLFEEAIVDGRSLTAGEADLLSQILGRWFEVTASVKKQNYVEPNFSYQVDTGVLTVTATADKSYTVQAEQAFDYYYVPKTIKLKINDEVIATATFTKASGQTYTATFTNVPDDTVCDFDLLYKLAVDVGSDAQSMINDGFAAVDNLLSEVPELIERVNTEVTDAIGTYLNGEQGFATLLWNAYNEMGVDALLADLDQAIADLDDAIANAPDGSQEKADAIAAKEEALEARSQAEDSIKALFGPIFDICGASLKGNASLNSALAAVANGTATDRQKTNAEDQVTKLNEDFGSTLNWETGARGYINVFLDYWNNVISLAVANGQFNDINGLGQYIGANYLAFYDLLKDIRDCAQRAVTLLTDPDNYIVKLLNEKNFTIDGKQITAYAGQINEIFALINRGFAYVDGLLASDMYTSLVNTHGDNVPALCGQYLEQAFDVVSNPRNYFGIETDGTFVEGFEFPQTASYETEPAGEKVIVTVSHSGYGKYAVNGNEYSSTQQFKVNKGSTIEVTPVEYGAETLFNYFAIGDANGNERLSPTGGTLTVYSNTNLIVYFANLPLDEGDPMMYDAVFMTNYELSNKYISSSVVGEVNNLPAVPVIEDATFLGWATENVSGAAAEAAGLIMDENDVLDAANNATSGIIFYAIYKYNDVVVDDAMLANLMTMRDHFVKNHQAYFSFLFSDLALGAGDTIVEAGVLAAASADTIAAATPNGGAGIVKGNIDFSVYSLPMVYTYSIYFKDHSTDKTAYAKAFVTIRHSDGTYETLDSNVYSLLVPGY